MLEHACRFELEGIVSKWADLPYRSVRGGHWIKSKCLERQEFIILGYIPSTAASRSVGTLALGYHDNQNLIYAGRVGTGWPKSRRDRCVMSLRQSARPSRHSPNRSPPAPRKTSVGSNRARFRSANKTVIKGGLRLNRWERRRIDLRIATGWRSERPCGTQERVFAEMPESEQRWQSDALFLTRSIGAGQTPDREFDAAAGEFAPGFDFRHVGRFRELREIGARFDLRRARAYRSRAAKRSRLTPLASAPVWRDRARCPPVFFAQRSFLAALVTQKPAKDPIIAAKSAAQNLYRGERRPHLGKPRRRSCPGRRPVRRRRTQICSAIMEPPAASRQAIAQGFWDLLESQPSSRALASHAKPRQWPAPR